MFEFTTAAERAHILKRVFVISRQMTLPDRLWRCAPYMCLEDGEAWALTGRRPNILSPPRDLQSQTQYSACRHGGELFIQYPTPPQFLVGQAVCACEQGEDWVPESDLCQYL